jgi:hypothetical protein
MKKKIMIGWLLITIFTPGLVVYAADGSALTSHPGLKTFVTFILLLLVVTLASYLIIGSTGSDTRRRTPIFIGAAMGLALMGSLLGLLAAMMVTVIVERAFDIGINNMIRLLIIFLAGGTIIFFEARFSAAKLLKCTGIRLNLLSLILALFTNPVTCIFAFELVNRLIK